MESEITTVVWDGDNTLWDWMKYAVPAYEAMCQKIADIAGKSFDETAAAMKVFYTLKGTIEDAGLVQGLKLAGFFDGMADFDLHMTILEARRVFDAERKKHFELYSGIFEIVKELHGKKLKQIILTDAPQRQAKSRLRKSGLRPYIEEIHTMPKVTVPDLPAEFERDDDEDQLLLATILTVEKPHTDLVELLAMTRQQIAKCVALIGDNMTKEMALAEAYGCLGIHAAYGAATEDYIRRLQKFAPPRVIRRNMNEGKQDGSSVSRIRSANQPEGIMEHLFAA